MMGNGSKYQCLILLLLHHSSVSTPEKFEVLGPSEPVVAAVGEDVVLPCYVKPSMNAEALVVKWSRAGPTEPVILLQQKDAIRREDELAHYKDKINLFPEELRRGNVSAKLSKVQTSDHGEYTCFVGSQDWFDLSLIRLAVQAVGTPPVVSRTTDGNGVFGLQCESKGWYPEPEVFWLDSDGNKLPAGPRETHRDKEGLFTVRHLVLTEKKSSNRFTCRVVQEQLHQTKETK
ncbi:butyrophilin subfamily 1 member A1-like, partial [Arapaima gigas]